MRSLDQWFSEYAVSHQNETNQLIHYICVPAIFFSIVGLLMSIPPGPLTGIFPMYIPFLENWAVVALILVLLFYMRLSVSMGIKILIFAGICIAGNYFISQVATLWLVSLIIFAVAWVGPVLWTQGGREKTFISQRYSIPPHRPRMGDQEGVWIVEVRFQKYEIRSQKLLKLFRLPLGKG